MIKVGITGIFGSGKSTVSGMFKKFGINVISCDTIVSNLLKTKSVREEIKNVFGKDFLTAGKIDRKKLASIIFSSKRQREKLNNVIHPLVFEKIKKFLDRFSAKSKIIIIEIPLLFETNSSKDFDVTITVSACHSVIKRRLKNKFSEDEIKKRWFSQIPLKKKIKKSDFIIDNNGSLNSTEIQVKNIIEKILDL
ncbi:MAG: dephospho-CoA kinase [Candidatus Omnitrophica bacterium]|nr:dephospho-CoA kinase [Candidatus Omnitrophota bacterium]